MRLTHVFIITAHFALSANQLEDGKERWKYTVRPGEKKGTLR